jgi:hypothetical protein
MKRVEKLFPGGIANFIGWNILKMKKEHVKYF